MKTIRNSNNIKTFIIEDNDKVPDLLEAYKLIETDIVECVNLMNGDCFIICEEGKLRNKPINRYATEIWEKSFSSNNNSMQFYDVIVGNAIYIPKHLRKDHW
tara:strand:- start:427 stop:732 length:306 start_codon:yes stop_codon:yes gene_type:complete